MLFFWKVCISRLINRLYKINISLILTIVSVTAQRLSCAFNSISYEVIVSSIYLLYCRVDLDLVDTRMCNLFRYSARVPKWTKPDLFFVYFSLQGFLQQWFTNWAFNRDISASLTSSRYFARVSKCTFVASLSVW